MEITEVRIKLTSGKNEKLRAFCSITIDNDFVIRDLKVIEGAKGAFVAMPSRKLMARCSFCGGKNHYRAPYCNECGGRLSPEKLSLDGRRKLHADVAHPINSSCRESIQQRVLAFYQEETEKAKDPNYRPVDIDDYDDDFFDEEEIVSEASPRWTGQERQGRVESDGDAESVTEDAETVAEESEWEETRMDVDSGEETATASESARGQREDRPSEGGGRSASHDGSRSGGGRRAGRSRQRSGGRRRRGPFRDQGRSGDRDRSREPGERRSNDETRETAREERASPLAVEFDSLRTGRGGRQGRSDRGRQVSGRRGSGRGRSDRARPGSGSRSGGLRDTRHREDEGTGESRFRERGGERRSDAAAKFRDAGRLPDGRIPEKLPIEETDVEPEDNFGSGLFS